MFYIRRPLYNATAVVLSSLFIASGVVANIMTIIIVVVVLLLLIIILVVVVLILVIVAVVESLVTKGLMRGDEVNRGTKCIGVGCHSQQTYASTYLHLIQYSFIYNSMPPPSLKCLHIASHATTCFHLD